ncbi:MAG: double-strand break repair helicase AddA [Alphaproteobacteria bacterium]|nr:double-strand break repair helicase AddA [Alphaproteobacteria bacterium]
MTADRKSIIAAASRNQHNAAMPRQSVWVSANAGTGKTRVLTNRILRLLIDGAAVTDILAVTYTRAAAAEMRNRLYQRLARWAVIDETTLAEDIQDMGVDRPSRKQIDRARRLFAELLDAPVPIRIETVHAFAQSVLRRFPVEAQIQPYFELATASQARAMKDEAVMDVMSSSDPLVLQSLRHLAQVMSEDQLVQFAAQMFSHSELLRRTAATPAAVKAELFSALGCADAAHDHEAAIAARISAAMAPDAARDGWLSSLVAAKKTEGTAKEKETAAVLEVWLAASAEERALLFDGYCGFFLTKDGGIRKSHATKKVLAVNPDFERLAHEEGERLLEIQGWINSVRTAALTMAIYVVAAEMATGYGLRKTNAGLMDYDDLISKTVTLFAQDGGVSWVRYKLDKGIQHLLIDEAQDTSPSQWSILSSLAEEFFDSDDGSGPPDHPPRSLFSVGDYKQSIYSFQGARPDLFHVQEKRFADLAGRNQKPFAAVELDTSFRTTSAVLGLVDAVTRGDDGDAPDYLPGLGAAAAHQVSRIGDAGFVEMLDPVAGEDEDTPAPFTPHRHHGSASPDVRLAQKIVATLTSWIGRKMLPSRGRVMTAGDVLILLRRRVGFGEVLDRELRRSGLPLAGADRVKLIDDIAVMDLMALGQVMLLPEDDLTLAAVLKSPLFEVTEEELFALAYDRGEMPLVRRLAAQAAVDARMTAVHDRLNTWLGLAETMTPYEFFRAVLDSDIRKAFTRRLGQPVLDIMAEFLEVARDFEDVHPPSMQGFLAMLTASDLEITREGKTEDSDEIRIMTIHGAKGLEAPVVILPDLLTQLQSGGVDLLTLDHKGMTLPIKPVRGGAQSEAVIAAQAAAKQAQEDEANRLLYVGLTRAEDGLLLAGFEAARRRKLEGSWYQLIRQRMEAMPGCQPRPDGDGVMIETLQLADVEAAEHVAPAGGHYDTPDWLTTPAPEEETPPRPLSPSRFSGDVVGSSPTGQNRRVAMLRGSLTHRLLEVLPGLDDDARRRAIARITAPYVPGQLDDATARRAVDETLRLIADHQLSDLFSPEARAEVPVSGLVGKHVVSGVIDRLVITTDAITIVDFKTGASPQEQADVPPAYIFQMALYAHVLAEIWPDRQVRAGLIYTEDARVHWLDAAVMSTTIADLVGTAP